MQTRRPYYEDNHEDLISLRNGLMIYTKIILITDGEPTEICLHRGPDIPDPKQMAETKTLSVVLMESMSSRSLDLFCVPVGDANKDFLNLLFSKEGGRRFLNYRDGQYFSRRYFLTGKVEPYRNLFLGIKYEIPRQDPELTARDFAHMQEIIDDATTKNFEEMKRKEENPYQEAINERLLPLGSRVRRGPDWTSGVEDDEGPGTVVGHNLYRDMLWVHWDKTEEIRQYSYGDMNLYGVLPVDEPRILLPGQPLAVGCIVTTGKDWRDDEAPEGSRGVIINMGSRSGTRKAVVRWENGKRTVSSYGDDKIYEIMLCLTDQSLPAPITSPQIRPALQYRPQRPAVQTHQPARPAITAARNSEPTRLNKNQTKNKNKNSN
ncbi:uncharacterized protein LOC132753902 [Ruditapes philippinarum]|uniref:uncharacterized protein LOC132753902 n=1 Tax=Ruditapes philippinarum TaxID=129788 RepID=UPI00295BCD42|nr:uncharacterized protein LOC132753902 [Ruditapes philippinarum]